MMQIPSALWQNGVYPASQQQDLQMLASGVGKLDAFFDGGLPFGTVIECGMPLGKAGRYALLPYLKAATGGQKHHPFWVLWVTRQEGLQPFPPAWYAQGISSERLVFASTNEPVRHLQRIFLQPFFKCIILDRPAKLSRDDCAFLNRQARRQKLMIILVRDFFLSHKRGNIWAKLRWNCWQKATSEELQLKALRGLEERQISLPLDVILSKGSSS